MTRPVRPVNRLRFQPPRSTPRVTHRMVAELAFRLTNRDKQLLELLWTHRVLTTTQIHGILFPSLSKTRQRLLELHRMAVIERFRPWTPVGTEPFHWVLGPAGARVLIHHLAVAKPKEFGYRPETALGIAHSRKLGHQVGVNEFFTGLLRHARRRNDGSTLDVWMSEQECAPSYNGYYGTADAFGSWAEPPWTDGKPRRLAFYLEHDTGTEPLIRVAEKAHGYLNFLNRRDKNSMSDNLVKGAILFWLPSPAREGHLRRLLVNYAERLPIVTSVHTAHPGGPAATTWQPLTPETGRLTWENLVNHQSLWRLRH